jgi:16S rRNA G966 N2-methylase RsmD
MLTTIKTSDVVVGQRLRKVDEKKVEELAQSIRDLGRLINPISIDEKNNLIAGNHRLSAHKLLEIEEIPAIVFSADDLMSKLMEIDENLYTNPLCFISQSESIQQREIILQSLGKRTKRGDNRFTEKGKGKDVFSTDALAEKLGVSNRVYRLRRQVSNLIPSVRNALRGTRHANNLVDLVVLSRMEDEVQEKVAELIENDDTNKSLKLFITEAKISVHTDEEKTETLQRVKDKFGVPYSVMTFDRDTGILDEMVSSIADICRGNRAAYLHGKPIKNYVGFASHSLFLLDYFVRAEDAKILDCFMGTGVNLITGLFLGMDVTGFDLDPKKVDALYECCDNNFGQLKYEFFNEDGTKMKPLKDKQDYYDGILCDPPYLKSTDQYTEEKECLSNQDDDKFLMSIKECLSNLKRLIKKSSVKDKKFYPIMMKMNSSRNREKGVVSMDFLINEIGERLGLTLWDRTFNIVRSVSTPVTIPRCYENHYTVKNWETTLVWIKQ